MQESPRVAAKTTSPDVTVTGPIPPHPATIPPEAEQIAPVPVAAVPDAIPKRGTSRPYLETASPVMVTFNWWLTRMPHVPSVVKPAFGPECTTVPLIT